MESILKALGLTIWGLVGLGLLAIFLFVGYEAALKYRASNYTQAPADAAKDRTDRSTMLPSSVSDAASTSGRTDSREPGMRANEETRRLFLSAAKSNQFDSAIDYGQQLANAKAAQPSDLAIIAQSYLSIGDCENAQLWAGTADDAFRSTGLAPDESLHRVSACCATGRNRPPANLDAAQRAHIDQLLSGSGAAKAATGGSLVRLGELYYGYGEYELAIAAIQLGLKKGKVAHLDEAYVYLGRAEQALGKIDEARAAFGQLKDVPGINPRVLRLWTLYAETQLSESAIGQCAPKSG